jgi:hypothetical protein
MARGMLRDQLLGQVVIVRFKRKFIQRLRIHGRSQTTSKQTHQTRKDTTTIPELEEGKWESFLVDPGIAGIRGTMHHPD